MNLRLQWSVLIVKANSAPPEIGTPVTHRLDEPNQLSLVNWKLLVVRCHCSAKERNDTITLVKHRAEACTGCVTIYDEAFGEIRHL
jgi:hypothetical protein